LIKLSRSLYWPTRRVGGQILGWGLRASLGFVAACAGPLAFDGTSESLGSHANGALRHPSSLLSQGEGYSIGEPWRQRQSNRGSDELVETVVRASRAVSRSQPGGVAAIGDLSRAGGGGSAEHKSHQDGRDVDIFYYAVHPSGLPAIPGNTMIHYDRSGRSFSWSPARGRHSPSERVPDLRFDGRRNWRMVRALLLDPDVEVQWIFIQRDLAARLLQEGKASGEDPALLSRALVLLRQPADSEPHDDHMHVRVFCDPDDRAAGCSDKGPPRWWKKHWKYMRPPFGRRSDVETGARLREVLRSRIPLPLAGGNLTT
jgi:penicillin-insensitive murein endopeptidase